MRVFDMQRPAGDWVRVRASFRVVSGEYMSALGMRVRRGRLFSNGDTASSGRAAVVNAAFADQYLGDRAVGAVVPLGSDEQPDWEIVGVVDNVRSADTSPVGPEMFVPSAQWQDNRPGGNPVIAVRTVGPPTRTVAHPALHRRRHRSDAGPRQGRDHGGPRRRTAGQAALVFGDAGRICGCGAGHRGRGTLRRPVVQRSATLSRACGEIGAWRLSGGAASTGAASGPDADLPRGSWWGWRCQWRWSRRSASGCTGSAAVIR